MTGYLTRLAVRSTRSGEGLRPRTPSLFESATAVPDTPPPLARTPGSRAGRVAPDAPAAEGRPAPLPAPLAPTAADLPDPPAPRRGRPRPVAAGTEVPEAPTTSAPTGAPRPTLATVPVAGPEVTADRQSLLPAELPSLTPTVTADPAPTRSQQPGRTTAPAGTTGHAERPATSPATGPVDADPAWVPPQDVALPRLHPGPAPAGPAPEVTVTIGRIEVVAPPAATASAGPTPPTRRTRPARATHAPALADYLRERSRR